METASPSLNYIQGSGGPFVDTCSLFTTFSLKWMDENTPIKVLIGGITRITFLQLVDGDLSLIKQLSMNYKLYVLDIVSNFHVMCLLKYNVPFLVLHSHKNRCKCYKWARLHMSTHFRPVGLGPCLPQGLTCS